MRSALRMTPAVNSWRHHIALMVELHQRGEHQPVRMRHERADVGGELEGQHGDGAIGEIDAGAAQARFGIDGRAGPHVMADVGDVDVQREVAVGQAIDPDGIVEIARGFAIDGDDVHAAEIAAAGQFARR